MPPVRMCRLPNPNGLNANSMPHVLVPWMWSQFLHYPDPPSPNCVPAMRMRPLPNTSNDSLSDSTHHHPNPYYSSGYHRPH